MRLGACGQAPTPRAARSLHSVHDEEKPFEMELAWICEASGREFRRVPAELAAAAERQAKASLADSDMCARPRAPPRPTARGAAALRGSAALQPGCTDLQT